MFPPNDPLSRLPRFASATRRARLVQLAAAGTLILLPAACGTNDADTFTTPVESVTSESVTSETGTTDTGTTDTGTTDTAATDTGTTDTGAATVPASTEMVVEFTYAASGGSNGPVRNPYIAVWIEDTDGNLVQTVSVWYEQSGKGTRWLDDLSSWYSSSGGDALSTGATRAAGTYSVVWDGTGLDGQPVSAGEYVVYVESAREHGDHSVTATTITLGDSPTAVTLPDDGELSALTATVTV